MVRNPPHILITTPESLYLILTSPRARSILSTVETVIVDEIHTLSANKRGVHLSITLERLEQIAPGFQRIGLSATQRPLTEVARLLGRTERVVGRGRQRQVRALSRGQFRSSTVRDLRRSRSVSTECRMRMAETQVRYGRS